MWIENNKLWKEILLNLIIFPHKEFAPLHQINGYVLSCCYLLWSHQISESRVPLNEHCLKKSERSFLPPNMRNTNEWKCGDRQGERVSKSYCRRLSDYRDWLECTIQLSSHVNHCGDYLIYLDLFGVRVKIWALLVVIPGKHLYFICFYLFKTMQIIWWSKTIFLVGAYYFYGGRCVLLVVIANIYRWIINNNPLYI